MAEISRLNSHRTAAQSSNLNNFQPRWLQVTRRSSGLHYSFSKKKSCLQKLPRTFQTKKGNPSPTSPSDLKKETSTTLRGRWTAHNSSMNSRISALKSSNLNPFQTDQSASPEEKEAELRSRLSCDNNRKRLLKNSSSLWHLLGWQLLILFFFCEAMSYLIVINHGN